VEFQFKPSLQSLYFSVSAIVIGIILAGYLILTRAPVAAQVAPAVPATSPLTRPSAVANPVKGQRGNGKVKGRK
jgi:hypothetical protein